MALTKANIFAALLPSFENILIWINAVILCCGIFILHWKPEVVIVAYFLETTIIGVIHVFKLFIVLRYGHAQKHVVPNEKNRLLTGAGAIPFFILHYFFFIFVQSIFVFTILEKQIDNHQSSFNVIGNYAYLLSQHDVFMAFIALTFTNVSLTLKNFLLPRAYHRTTVASLFFQPYVRIFIQQFVTLVSWFLMFISNSAFAGAMLIICMRLFVDLLLQRATTQKEFKAQLLQSLKKGQKPDEAAKTAESLDSFLQR